MQPGPAQANGNIIQKIGAKNKEGFLRVRTVRASNDISQPGGRFPVKGECSKHDPGLRTGQGDHRQSPLWVATKQAIAKKTLAIAQPRSAQRSTRFTQFSCHGIDLSMMCRSRWFSVNNFTLPLGSSLCKSRSETTGSRAGSPATHGSNFRSLNFLSHSCSMMHCNPRAGLGSNRSTWRAARGLQS